MKRVCNHSKLLLLIMATSAIIAALFAGILGIDPDNRWGSSRLGLLAFGIGILSVLLIDRLVDVFDHSLLTRTEPTGRELDRSQRKEPHPIPQPFAYLLSRRGTLISVVFAIVAVICLYLGLASGVHLARVPQDAGFYNLLADAFLQGQTSLLVEPPSALEELASPWQRSGREGIPVLGDASYYQGKYYLYWGPAPAIVAALWKAISHIPVGDKYVTFVGVSLTFVFSFLSMVWIRRRYLSTVPVWLFGGFVVFIATAHPMLWVLNPARIYEASIACGQAFLFAGIYFALPLWEGGARNTWRYFLVGVLWSLAIASRLVLFGAIAVLVIATGIYWLVTSNRAGKKIGANIQIIALVLPLLISLAVLGLYNHARFGSFFETGIRYQLSMNDLNPLVEDQHFMSLKFIPANIIYYFFTPFRIRDTYPFIRAFYNPVPGFSSIVRLLGTPGIHFVENATGVFFSTSIQLLIIPFAWNLVCTSIMKQQTQNARPVSDRNKNQQDHTQQLFGILLAASFAALIPFLSWYWVTTRFLLDAIPLLALSATIAVSIIYTENYRYPVRGRVATVLIMILLITGVGISFLLALSGPDSLFDDLNPALLDMFNSFLVR